MGDVLRYLPHVSSDALEANILEVQCLMRRKRIEHKAGTLEGGILKVLMCGEEQKSETQVIIGKIREANKQFVRKRNGDKKSKERRYRRRKKL